MIADEAIQVMVERVVERFDPLRVVLFGSYARGNASADSDVDLLIVLERVEDKRRAAIEVRRVLADLPICKDVLVTTPDELARRGNTIGSVLRFAMQEGKVLYERSGHD